MIENYTSAVVKIADSEKGEDKNRPPRKLLKTGCSTNSR